MNKSKCPVCGSNHTVKNGQRNGVQTYKCKDCRAQFRNSKLPSDDKVWQFYQENKQTISELSVSLRTSPSTVKRILQRVQIVWEQPDINGLSGYVHLDVTYWGHNWGVLLALDDATGMPLYVEFVKSETTDDYKNAIESIEARGFKIKGIIIDGKKSLFKEFSAYPIQMCHFHMKQIITRYLTKNPKLKAARALSLLMDTLTLTTLEEFESEYNKWKDEWRETLCRKSLLKSGKTQYTHKRLRSAMLSINFYLPCLFTFQSAKCLGMPNTNNKIEGTFTDLKKNLNNHSGMTKENRKRFICGFFVALRNAITVK